MRTGRERPVRQPAMRCETPRFIRLKAATDCRSPGGGSPLSRERVDDTERERKADQDDERPEQLAPGRVLAAYEPRGEDPDDRHEQGEGRNCRGWVARQQPVPGAVPEEARDDDDVGEGSDPGCIDRRGRALPACGSLEDQREPE